MIFLWIFNFCLFKETHLFENFYVTYIIKLSSTLFLVVSLLYLIKMCQFPLNYYAKWLKLKLRLSVSRLSEINIVTILIYTKLYQYRETKCTYLLEFSWKLVFAKKSSQSFENFHRLKLHSLLSVNKIEWLEGTYWNQKHLWL